MRWRGWSVSGNAAKIVRGDFQTPFALAAQVCELLARRGVCPAAVVEPTCGTGSFLQAARTVWRDKPAYFGFDLEPEHVSVARKNLPPDIRVAVQDFFTHDWHSFTKGLPPGNVLFLGNPPWVTNARQGVLSGANLLPKTNFHSLTGIEAKTGKSNFDISEWIIWQLIAAGLAAGRVFEVAMLCKSGTARKIIEGAGRRNLPVTHATLYRVDAGQWFGAAVEACLFRIGFDASLATASPLRVPCYAGLEAVAAQNVLGYADGALIADAHAYEQTRDLPGRGTYRWRSGVKHDLTKVCELRRDETGVLRNGYDDVVNIESERLYPLLKCTDLFHGRSATNRLVLLTQQATGEDTELLARRLPRTGAYLNTHRERFTARKSSIYRGASAFALFGIGDYTFAPYKVAVSGLHSAVRFRVVLPEQGKPVVMDDTCYFVGFDTEQEARQLLARLESDAVRQAIAAYLFADAKRPVTATLLARLPLGTQDGE